MRLWCVCLFIYSLRMSSEANAPFQCGFFCYKANTYLFLGSILIMLKNRCTRFHILMVFILFLVTWLHKLFDLDLPKSWYKYPDIISQLCPDSSPARNPAMNPWVVMTFILSIASKIKFKIPSSWNRSWRFLSARNLFCFSSCSVGENYI